MKSISFLLRLPCVAFALFSLNCLAAVPDLTAPALVAHWKFDEASGSQCLDAGPQGSHVTLQPALDARPRIRRIHGNALNLRDRHALKVRLPLQTKSLPTLSFSAWVRPVELPSYREIFRQECSNRLLFSFQEHGTIRSLGLDTDGYVECDAPIQPGQVLDGAWHHCAATFDGQGMRVYLDGREIGSLQRLGAIAVSPEPPAFIGSMDGASEHFQGVPGEQDFLVSANRGGKFVLYLMDVDGNRELVYEGTHHYLGGCDVSLHGRRRDSRNCRSGLSRCGLAGCLPRDYDGSPEHAPGSVPLTRLGLGYPRWISGLAILRLRRQRPLLPFCDREERGVSSSQANTPAWPGVRKTSPSLTNEPREVPDEVRASPNEL